MNVAIRESPNVGVAPWELEPQSSMSMGSHGTLVASIAAGNHGVCPDAEIAAVLIDISDVAGKRGKSFYNSTRIVHAVEYLVALARARGAKLAINISLGANGHAHDASSAASR